MPLNIFILKTMLRIARLLPNLTLVRGWAKEADAIAEDIEIVLRQLER